MEFSVNISGGDNEGSPAYLNSFVTHDDLAHGGRTELRPPATRLVQPTRLTIDTQVLVTNHTASTREFIVEVLSAEGYEAEIVHVALRVLNRLASAGDRSPVRGPLSQGAANVSRTGTL